MTDNDYRKLIERDDIKASDLVKRIKMPQKVWRYRRLAILRDNEWIESSHWEDDIDGICYYSVPGQFNKNDDNDCKVQSDLDDIMKYILNKFPSGNRRDVQVDLSDFLKQYQDGLQNTMRIGCFTCIEPVGKVAGKMWEDPNFGSDGRSICIEYNVDDDNFRPDGLPFLRVLYDDKPYDNTEAVKAVIDYVENKSDRSAIQRMLCLGYGHTIIKPKAYKNEGEWRLVIPIRDDGAHLDYFNVDGKSKRDLSNAIAAIYIGYNIDKLPEYKRYIDRILTNAKKHNTPVYQVIKDDDTLTAKPFVKY